MESTAASTFDSRPSKYIPNDEAPMDNIGFLDNYKQRNLLEDNEKLLYADNIKKYSNGAFFADTRTLVVTTENLYNVKKDSL